MYESARLVGYGGWDLVTDAWRLPREVVRVGRRVVRGHSPQETFRNSTSPQPPEVPRRSRTVQIGPRCYHQCMRALTVVPGRSGSVRLDELPEKRSDEHLLVQSLAVGICGTDREIVSGVFGEAPAGSERLVLGHESLGSVLESPSGAPFAVGDLVVGVVRHPDPEPCSSCAAGEPDMCRNGGYTEHGIKGRAGFLAERFLLDPAFAVRVDPRLARVGMLVEPASVLAKAWQHIETIGGRASWQPARVLVTGAGPVGLLGALMASQRGLEVHVLDRATSGPKPDLVRALGATYHAGSSVEACPHADIILECTGAGTVVLGAIRAAPPAGIVCLTGISSKSRRLDVDMAGLNRELVLENSVVFGSVNANRRHYEMAIEALLRADLGWLERLVSRRVPLARWEDALHRRGDDVKVVIEVDA
jgi:glucose 1-dehydrogenase